MKKIQEKLQKFGGSLYTPVLFTAFAGIMAGLTIVFLNADIVGDIANEGTLWYKFWKIIDAGVWAPYIQLPLLFAVGIPIGLAKKNKANAALVALISFMTYNYYIQAILSLSGVDITQTGGDTGLASVAGVTTYDMSVLGAIIVALIVVWAHERFFEKELPEILGTFGGSVLVYIVCFFVLVPVAYITHLVWPHVQNVIVNTQDIIIASGSGGIWIYSLLERLLIPTGLHHLVYTPFVYGPAVEQSGALTAYIEAIPTLQTSSESLATAFPAGGYMLSGMSKVFGSLGMAIAFYTTAKPEKRKKTLGLLIPITLTAMMVGVTEPFEYSFLFVAPVLFVIHSLLAATLSTLTFIIGVSGNFGGGLIPYATMNWIPLWDNYAGLYIQQILLGLTFTGIYFTIFRFLILKWNLKTPGRDDSEDVNFYTKDDYKGKKADNAKMYIELLGGAENINDLTNCATRLRITLNDIDLMADDKQFVPLGSKGIMKSGNAIQIIYGPNVAVIKGQIEDVLNS